MSDKFKNAKASNDVAMFWNLIAGFVDFRYEFLPLFLTSWKKITVPDNRDRFYLPVVEEVSYVTEDSYLPSAPMLQQDEVILNKWAWRWHDKNGPRMGYSFRYGVSKKTKSVFVSAFQMYEVDWLDYFNYVWSG